MKIIYLPLNIIGLNKKLHTFNVDTTMSKRIKRKNKITFVVK